MSLPALGKVFGRLRPGATRSGLVCRADDVEQAVEAPDGEEAGYPGLGNAIEGHAALRSGLATKSAAVIGKFRS